MKTNLICFLGGVAAAAAVKMVSSSPKTRQLCVKALAAGMKTTEQAKVAFQNLKEDAADLCAEAKAQLDAPAVKADDARKADK